MNSRMHEFRLAAQAIINESGNDKGLQRLGGKTDLLELQQLASAVTRTLAKASQQREDWALMGIHR